MRYLSRKGFTLIELLVVIAIIAILAAILFPVFAKAREKARQATCTNNLKQIGIACMQYTQDYDEYFPHSGTATSFYVQNLNWKQLIAPYLSVSPITAHTVENGVFRCPSKGSKSCGNSTYGDNGDYGGYGWNFIYLGWLPGKNQPDWVRVTAIEKPSSIIMAGETNDSYVYTGTGSDWSHGCFYLYATAQNGLTGADGFCQRHNGGGNYIWCDGHVSWITAKALGSTAARKWFDPSQS